MRAGPGRWATAARRLGPPLLWMGCISSLSTESFSAEHTGQVVSAVLYWLLPRASPAALEVLHLGIRKGAHLMEYGILALGWYAALHRGAARWQRGIALASLGVVVAFTGLDELHQAFVSSRTASLRDVGLDSLGAAVALLLCAMIQGVGRGGLERG